MYSALTIADAILKIAKAAGKSLTPLQLMKLVYIAHGWSLGLGRNDLFRNRIEAWRYGPVIPDLYRATKRFGRDPIPFDLIDDNPAPIDPDTIAFLEDIYAKYGHYTGIQLSGLTHQSGTPWDLAYRPNENVEIPDNLIARHYEGLLRDRQHGAPAA